MLEYLEVGKSAAVIDIHWMTLYCFFPLSYLGQADESLIHTQ